MDGHSPPTDANDEKPDGHSIQTRRLRRHFLRLIVERVDAYASYSGLGGANATAVFLFADGLPQRFLSVITLASPLFLYALMLLIIGCLPRRRFSWRRPLCSRRSSCIAQLPQTNY